jgi:hypothetical protein
LSEFARILILPAHTTLDPREIARRLGTLSIEERVQILKSLLDAGPAGQQMPEIAVSTGLGAPAVYKQLEALIGAEMVGFRSVDNNKVYWVNEGMLKELFDYMLTHYGQALPTDDGAAEGGRN